LEKVFIVGEKPAWVKNVTHISVKDFNPKTKIKNTTHKLKVAVESGLLPDKFTLMNDDFFLLESMNEIPVLYYDTLKSSIKRTNEKRGLYYRAKVATLALLEKDGYLDPLDYGLHIPFEMETKNLKEVLERVALEEGQYLIRTLYGNWFCTPRTNAYDVKMRGNWSGNPQGKKFLSTDSTVVLDKAFQTWIQNKFPKPSKFEA
jgi:hypothetical protein